MDYKVQQSRFTSLKVALIWNVVALCLNFIVLPIYYGYSGVGALVYVLIMMVFTLPVLGLDYFVYRKLKVNASKTIVILGLILGILSMLFLIKLPSVLITVVYIMILIKDKNIEPVESEEAEAINDEQFNQ